MYVYSGQVRLCETGIEAGFADTHSQPLVTGDIVIIFTDDYVPSHLTVVVADEEGPYVMGIKGVPMHDPGQWRVLRVKSAADVIEDERWPAWGFSYQSK